MLPPVPAGDQVEAARRFLDGLSHSSRRRFVLDVDGIRTAETRQRRIDLAVAALREGRV